MNYTKLTCHIPVGAIAKEDYLVHQLVGDPVIVSILLVPNQLNLFLCKGTRQLIFSCKLPMLDAALKSMLPVVIDSLGADAGFDCFLIAKIDQVCSVKAMPELDANGVGYVDVDEIFTDAAKEVEFHFSGPLMESETLMDSEKPAIYADYLELSKQATIGRSNGENACDCYLDFDQACWSDQFANDLSPFVYWAVLLGLFVLISVFLWGWQ